MEEICKEFIDWLVLNNKTQSEAVQILRKGSNIPVSGNHKIELERLTPDYKNLVILYTFPKLIGDYQLPKIIQEYRAKTNNQQNTNSGDVNEVAYILEAYRGKVYENFIRHLFWGFCKNDNGETDYSKVIRVQPIPELFKGCPICGESDINSFYFGSTDSPFTICNKCMPNLIKAARVLDIFEPNYMLKYRTGNEKHKRAITPEVCRH
jgi:hypothetical protein